MTSDELGVRMELHDLENERKTYQIELEKQKKLYSNLLNGEMGKDMFNVLNGKEYVTIPLKDRIMFKIKCFFGKIFKKI